MANRNVSLLVGDQRFLVPIHNPNETREDFIQRIGRILRSQGGAFNAERRRNIRIVIGDIGDRNRGNIDNIDFDVGISNRNEPREDFIQRIVEYLSTYHEFGSNNVVGPIVNVDPGVNAGTPLDVYYTNSGVNVGAPGGIGRLNLNSGPRVNLRPPRVNVAVPGVNSGPGVNVSVNPSDACRAAFNCPICLYQYSDDIQPTTLPCGHSLCITDASHVNSICPICRSPFVFANQRMSISLRDASIACSPGAHGGAHTRRRHKTKRRRQRSKRRR